MNNNMFKYLEGKAFVMQHKVPDIDKNTQILMR